MLLSVIILFTDNDSSFLEGAIKSIRNNIKFSDYEIIAVDNRNNQKEEIVLNNVKIISKGYNLNCFEGRRFGFENSKGDFIWNFDVDDLMIGELYEKDIKKEVDFMQMYYSFTPGSKRNPILKKHLPRAYGWNVWSRLYNRNLLQKIYSRIERPVNIFMYEDKVLFDFVESYDPKYEYIERIIYQYNVTNATNTPENKNKNLDLIKTGLDEYDYVYGVLGKPYLSKEMKRMIEWIIKH